MPEELLREYEGRDGVVVEWRPALCQHSERCWRALPAVFDPDRRPWVEASAASRDELVATVAECPSGALRIKQGVAVEPTSETVVTVTANGPLLLRGNIRLVAVDGTETLVEKAALCRCGGSQNKPFCDGSHKTNGFAG